jgi:hypothetical protein
MRHYERNTLLCQLDLPNLQNCILAGARGTYTVCVCARGTYTVCVCVIHQNVTLMVQGAHLASEFNAKKILLEK